MSGFRTRSYKCPGSERNHTNVRVWNFPPCPIVVAASGICVGAAGVALKCHLMAKSGHHLLTQRRPVEAAPFRLSRDDGDGRGRGRGRGRDRGRARRGSAWPS